MIRHFISITIDEFGKIATLTTLLLQVTTAAGNHSKAGNGVRYKRLIHYSHITMAVCLNTMLADLLTLVQPNS